MSNPGEMLLLKGTNSVEYMHLFNMRGETVDAMTLNGLV